MTLSVVKVIEPTFCSKCLMPLAPLDGVYAIKWGDRYFCKSEHLYSYSEYRESMRDSRKKVADATKESKNENR